MIKLVKIMGESLNYSEALKGFWGYDGQKDYHLSVHRGLGHIMSPIAEKVTTIELKLPECYDFYAQVNSANGCRFVKVENSHLSVTLAVGEQLNTNFRMK